METQDKYLQGPEAEQVGTLDQRGHPGCVGRTSPQAAASTLRCPRRRPPRRQLGRAQDVLEGLSNLRRAAKACDAFSLASGAHAVRAFPNSHLVGVPSMHSTSAFQEDIAHHFWMGPPLTLNLKFGPI